MNVGLSKNPANLAVALAVVLGSRPVGMLEIQCLIIHGLRAFGLAQVRCRESDLPSDVVTGIVSVNLLF